MVARTSAVAESKSVYSTFYFKVELAAEEIELEIHLKLSTDFGERREERLFITSLLLAPIHS